MQAVIFIGAQATGKSNFFKERFFDTHVRINLDMLKSRHREKIFLDACLQSGQSFVVDNTNPKLEDRQRYIVPSQEAGFEVVGYYFESQISAALTRNQQRSGKQRIPEGGIRATFCKLQVPSLDEGFDKLYKVRLASQGLYIVEEMESK